MRGPRVVQYQMTDGHQVKWYQGTWHQIRWHQVMGVAQVMGEAPGGPASISGSLSTCHLAWDQAGLILNLVGLFPYELHLSIYIFY